MKHLGKRVLSMVLALGITVSMLVSDVSAMQVYAAGSTEYVDEETTVELLSEDLEGESLAEDSSEEESSENTSVEETSEEESSVEEPSGEIESVEEESSQTDAEEGSTETTSSVEGTTEEASSETETASTEEVTTVEPETEVINTEEVTTEETESEELTTEESATEETTETVVEETTEELLTEEATTEMATEEMAVSAMEGKVAVYANSPVLLNEHENGVLKVPEGTVVSGKIKIGADIEVIPNGIFDGNYSVTSVEFETGSKLREIQERAFMGSYIESIRFPASLETIGEQAFQFSRLENITFVSGDKTVTLGKLAFADNSNLKTVTTNGRLSTVGEAAFSNNTKLEKTVDLDGVTSIGKKAFYGCESLDYIEIPDTVTVIEESTFENCKTFGDAYSGTYRGVNAVRLGNGVTTIKDSAFKGCNKLVNVILPKNINSLGRDVFSGCTALKTIEIQNEAGTDSTNACDISLTYTSFPSLKGLVLKAYDGTVEDWVGSHTSYGVKFETLYKSYAIKIAACEGGTVTANVKTAQYGDTVTLTVKPVSGYVLESYESLRFEYADEATYGTKPVEINPLDCSFKMPACDVTVYADFAPIKPDDFGEKLVLTEDNLTDKTNSGEGEITYDEEKNHLSFSKPWQGVRIQVKDENGNTPMYTQLKFSSNSKAVTIDEKGYIRALAPTTSTKITVAFVGKNYSTEPLTFTVSVDEETFVKNISLDYKASRADIDICGDSKPGDADEVGYDIITYRSSLLNTDARTITIAPVGTDEDGDVLDISYQLTSNDSSIAKPKATKFMGEGTLTIPKGALGETVVTVKAVDKSDKPAEKQFIVRIIDDTPRLADSTITVDPQSSTGTFIDLVSVYEKNPEVSDLSIRKKVVSKGNTVYETTDGIFVLEPDENNNKLYLSVPDTEGIYKAGKNYTYKNTYYIHGTLEDTDTEFYIPIPNLTICRKNIKPSVKLSGKINLFYNGKATEAQQGIVTVTQNQKNLVVESCELVGIEKANGVDNTDDGAFKENFDVNVLTQGEKQTITITRSDTEKLSCYSDGRSKGKPVLNGLIRIKYEGYSDSFDIKITVPTHTTAPSYTLDTPKITLNSRAAGQEYDVKFINKKTKEPEIFSSNTTIKLDIQEGGTTDGLIEEGENFTFTTGEDSKIHLKIADAKKGKIVLILRQPEWEDQSGWNKKSAIKATINVSASSAFPTAKLGKTTLNVNMACPEATDYTNITLNQLDSTLEETQEFVPSGRTRSDAIDVSYVDGKVVAEITDSANVKKGTYSYTCYPEFKFYGSDYVDTAKAITVKVVVKDTTPSIKLKKTSFTLNASCQNKNDGSKYDYVTTDFSWVNLPPEYEGYELSTDEMSIALKSGTDYIGRNNVRFELDDTNNTAKIYVEADAKRIGKGTYIISGLKLVSDSGAEIPIGNISISINNIDKTPTVTVSAKGTINPLDPASKIEYTPKLANINGTVVDVELRELAENGSLLPVEDAHFEAVHNPATGKTIVKVKEPEIDPDTGEVISRVQLEKRTYKIQLFYVLSNGNSGSARVPGTYQVAKDQKITPKQTMPKISVDTKSATFFAGNKERTKIITVTKKSTATAEISGIKFSSKTPKYLQNAFYDPSYDPATGEVVLKLKNSAFIQQNKEQTLTFEIVCDGQLKDTTGTTFAVKVKVIK